ncbi:MAG: nucleotide exchange factor GrpE [Steroidobacteraceae bacterium]
MTSENDTAPTPEAPVGEDAAAALAAAQAKADEHWQAYLRAVAETENVRKRAARDVEAASRYAIERFAGELLEVRDSLELGIAAGAAADPARLLEGMEATLRLVNRAFEKSGISVLDPAGQPFNPEFHEAMVTQPSADQPPGTVLAVVQKGYVLNGRLLRPARVVIARAPDPTAN